MKKIYLFIFTILFAGSAFSEIVPKEVIGYTSPYLKGSYPDGVSICKAMLGTKFFSNPEKMRFESFDSKNYLCAYRNENNGLYNYRVSPVMGCPSGSKEQGGVCVKGVQKEDDDSCSLKTGKDFVQNVPLGSVKITDLDSGKYDFKYKEPPKSLCDGGCAMRLKGDFWGHSYIDRKKSDANGYHTYYGSVVYTATGGKCVADDKSDGLQEPSKSNDEEKVDKDKCEGEGGYYGQVNGKDVCLGVDDKQNKCLPGQTYGKVNGKDVCLTPEGDQLPVPKPGHENKPGNGNGGNGNGTGNGQGNGNGKGNGQGSGGGGGGGGFGNGKGEGKGDKEKGDGAGPGFGDQPGLYEPRYKNGLKGVWDQKKGQLQNTQLGQLSKRLMPSVNSGTCPRWDIDLNFGRNMNFGTRNVAPPCMIWPILRAIVMVCALMLARRLVFGG